MIANEESVLKRYGVSATLEYCSSVQPGSYSPRNVQKGISDSTVVVAVTPMVCVTPMVVVELSVMSPEIVVVASTDFMIVETVGRVVGGRVLAVTLVTVWHGSWVSMQVHASAIIDNPAASRLAQMAATLVPAVVDLEELLLALEFVLVEYVFFEIAGARLRCWRFTVVTIVTVLTAWVTVASVVDTVTTSSIVESFETTAVPFVVVSVEMDVVETVNWMVEEMVFVELQGGRGKRAEQKLRAGG